MQATNTAGYDAPIGLTADPVVFTLLDGRLCVLLARRLEEPQRGMFALPGRVRRSVRGAGADRRAQAAREDRRRLGAPRAAAHLRRSLARPARLAALDRLHGAGPPRDAARGAPRRPRRLLAPARRAARARARPRDHRRRRSLAPARARGRQGVVRAQGARAAERAVHAAPGPAALRGAARRGGRRRELPPRRPRHGAAGGHRLAALGGPGPAGRLYRRA